MSLNPLPTNMLNSPDVATKRHQFVSACNDELDKLREDDVRGEGNPSLFTDDPAYGKTLLEKLTQYLFGEIPDRDTLKKECYAIPFARIDSDAGLREASMPLRGLCLVQAERLATKAFDAVFPELGKQGGIGGPI